MWEALLRFHGRLLTPLAGLDAVNEPGVGMRWKDEQGGVGRRAGVPARLYRTAGAGSGRDGKLPRADAVGD